MQKPIQIEGRTIGPGQPPYVVAELSANHNGDINRALELIAVAKASGADAVKLQTYTADTMTIDCDLPQFMIKGGLWDGYKLYDLYKEASTPWDWHAALMAKGRELGITVFSTPFDETAVNFLEELNVPAYKIASFELVDLPLIRRVAATRKPIIMSTGMANDFEIQAAVDAAHAAGCADLILLHCVSSYPAPPEQSNLRMIPEIAERFNVIAGLSDHTLGIDVAAASVALGAAVIEKHFTFRRAEGGPDAAFSLEPEELTSLVRSVRSVWSALGKVSYERQPAEEANVVFRRSLYVVRDIAAGERFTKDNVRPIRPGFGLPPDNIDRVLGAVAARDIRTGTPLSEDLIEARK